MIIDPAAPKVKAEVPGSQALEGLLHKSRMSPDLKDTATLKALSGGFHTIHCNI